MSLFIVLAGNMTTFTNLDITGLSDKDKEIFEKNNIRLLQLANELRDISTYGGACDELLSWITDPRAYNIHNENALLECISVIRDKAMEYGPWSGMQTLKVVNEHCMKLSANGQGMECLFINFRVLTSINYYRVY
jgi:hypothetical protein